MHRYHELEFLHLPFLLRYENILSNNFSLLDGVKVILKNIFSIVDVMPSLIKIEDRLSAMKKLLFVTNINRSKKILF